ncbi:MAG TPA: bacterioferritin [Leucothrix sp.]|nr:bacterioferritin [Leucothrix sp.]
MKGNNEIIAKLNELLTGELTAADQYFTHSRMLEDFGYSKLYERLSHEAEEELQHADVLIKRILFLEGVPDLSKRSGLDIGADVVAMFKSDLAVEYQVGKDLREAIKLCEDKKDYQTRHVLMPLLSDTEEDHMYWLEQQLGLIERVGLQNYCQSQI